MLSFKSMPLLCAGVILMAMPADLLAKRVVCIDGPHDNDAFINNHEGWERQNAADDTIILVGGSLTDCLAQVEDGDELVIIAHGVNEGEGFFWGGQAYYGFGDGEEEMPLPDGFSDLTGISIDFCACWSTRDPDGADGEDTSLADKISDAVDAGASVNGFTDLAFSSSCFTVTTIAGSGATAADIKKAEDALKNDPSWSNRPPHNRPIEDGEELDTDLSSAQSIVDAAVGEGKITVGITYKRPVNRTVDQATDEEQIAKSGGIVVGNCGCNSPDEICGMHLITIEEENHSLPVIVDVPSLLPEGLFSNFKDWVFTHPQQPGGLLVLNDIRMFQTSPSTPLFDLGEISSFDAALQVICDIEMEGEVFEEQSGFGSATITAEQMPYSNGVEGFYFNLVLDGFNVNFPTPNGPLSIEAITPNQTGGGFLSAIPAGSGWEVESSLFLTPNVLLEGVQGSGCGGMTLKYRCEFITEGCTEQSAANYSACAGFDDGSCSGSTTGCTYPSASNYNPAAQFDDGSCVFVGCTDPEANNFNPFATNDNGTCTFAAPCVGDLDYNGTRGIGDLLIFLGVFSEPC